MIDFARCEGPRRLGRTTSSSRTRARATAAHLIRVSPTNSPVWTVVQSVPCEAVSCVAVPCDAVPCDAVPCSPVPCVAVPCVIRSMHPVRLRAPPNPPQHRRRTARPPPPPSGRRAAGGDLRHRPCAPVPFGASELTVQRRRRRTRLTARRCLGDGYLDPVAGHGTFIAGLIEQRCAGLEIVVERVIKATGDTMKRRWGWQSSRRAAARHRSASARRHGRRRSSTFR